MDRERVRELATSFRDIDFSELVNDLRNIYPELRAISQGKVSLVPYLLVKGALYSYGLLVLRILNFPVSERVYSHRLCTAPCKTQTMMLVFLYTFA